MLPVLFIPALGLYLFYKIVSTKEHFQLAVWKLASYIYIWLYSHSCISSFAGDFTIITIYS